MIIDDLGIYETPLNLELKSELSREDPDTYSHGKR